MNAGAPLPPALSRALAERRLVVVAGAGISALPPSSLPDWSQFCEALVDGARRASHAAASPADPVQAAVDRIHVDDIGVKGVSEYFSKILGSEFYFPILGTLDGVLPNSNHRALARLAAEGTLRAIVTTNFDTLIEKGFASEGVPLRVATLGPASQPPGSSASCVLHKVHGSVGDRASLIDTVGQKVRGLPGPVRASLSSLFADAHVLVVGYSGADLDFQADYLALAAARESPYGLTWLLRAGTTPSSRIESAIVPEPGRREFCQATLPDFLLQCLSTPRRVEGEPPATHTPESPRPGYLDRITDLYARVGVAGANSLLLRMALDRGLDADADAIRAALAAEVTDRCPGDPIVEGLAVRQLAFAAHARGDGTGATRWTAREIEVRERQLADFRDKEAEVEARRAQGLVPDLPAPPPYEGPIADLWPRIAEETEEDFHRLLAGCWSNSANHILRFGDARAGAALERSLEHCELSLSGLSLVHMYGAYSIWLSHHEATVDEVLGRLATCEAAALLFGNLDTANDCAVNQARLFLLLGEYDAAGDRLRHVRSRFAVEAAHNVRQAVEELEHALAAHRTGTPPDLEPMRSRVSDTTERERRERLIAAEASRDADELSAAFEILGATLCNTSRFDRALPLTLGYERWARQELRSRDMSIACHLQAWAHWGLEDLASAGAACARAITARGAFDPRLSSSLLPALRDLAAPPSAEAAVSACRKAHAAIAPLLDGWSQRVASMLQIVGEWYASKHHTLVTGRPVQRVLEGGATGFANAAEIEGYATQCMKQGETTLVRVYAILAASEYRSANDSAGIARCIELLASAAELEKRDAQAERLRAKAARYDSMIMAASPAGREGT